MKRHTIFLMLVIVVTCLIGLAACGNNNDSGIQFKTLQVTDTTVYGEVSNDTSQFSFIDEISMSDSVTYDVCKDLACTETIPSKTVELNVGNNVFYLLVKKNHDVKLFTVTIRRRPLYLVTTEIDSDVTRRYVEENEQINEPQQPNVNGYTFSNWEINGTIATFPYTVIGNTTVKAKLVANQYTVAFDVNGGEPLTSSELVVTYNEYYSLEIPTREGYTFDGWYDNDTLLNNYDKWIYLQNKSLKAKWNINSYNITLSKNFTNAGDIVSISDQAEFNSQITISAIDNEYLGYTWLGWYDGETLLTTSLDFTFNVPAHNINYVAMWEVDERLENYEFTSDKATCVINGVKSKEIIEVSLPEYVTEIEDYAFKDCADLIEVIIPSSVRSIGFGAFNRCNKVTSMTIPFVGNNASALTNKHLGYMFGANNYSDNYKFVSNQLETVIITDELVIGEGAFNYCKSILNIVLPNTIKEVGADAFVECTGLTDMAIPESVQTIAKGAFCGCSNLLKITLPFIGGDNNNAKKSYFGYIFGDEQSNNGDNVPAKLEEIIITQAMNISEYAFCRCKNIRDIKIYGNATLIGQYAFAGCSKLESVIIPNSIAEILDYAFNNCYKLTNIELPPELIYIGHFSFCACDALTSIIIPKSVMTICRQAFQQCWKLQILCEIESQPEGWDIYWNISECSVVWNYKK